MWSMGFPPPSSARLVADADVSYWSNSYHGKILQLQYPKIIDYVI